MQGLVRYLPTWHDCTDAGKMSNILKCSSSGELISHTSMHSFIYPHMGPVLSWMPGLRNILSPGPSSTAILFWANGCESLYSLDSVRTAGHAMNVLYAFATWMKDCRYILAGAMREETGSPEGSGHLWKARKMMSTTQKEGKQLEEVKSEWVCPTHVSQGAGQKIRLTNYWP